MSDKQTPPPAPTASSQSQHNPWQRGAEEIERLERQFVEHGTRAFDDSLALFKGTLGYAVQLSSEWRRLSLDAMRRSAELIQR